MDVSVSSQQELCRRVLANSQKVIFCCRDSECKKLAYSQVPVDLINDRVDLRVRQSLGAACHPFVLETVYLKELVGWFKDAFFRWLEVPKCAVCEERMSCVRTQTESTGPIFTSTLEVYRCWKCGTGDRVRRFTDPRILFRTRVGRCAEFSLCFTLICLSLGIRARYVIDITDHCWTEVYSPYRHLWIHVDPSEGVVDRPLLYEHGWDKKLSYVFSVGETDVQDVTWRYSSDHKAVMSRRQLPSDNCISLICSMRYRLLEDLPEESRIKELLLVIEELACLLTERPAEGQYGSRISGVS